MRMLAHKTGAGARVGVTLRAARRLRNRLTSNRRTPKSFFEEEFSGTVRGFDYGFDQGDAEFAFFEFEDPINGASGGGGDGIFQERGVIAGVENHAGGTFHGLRGEKRSNIARQADLDASFGERFKNNVGKGRTAGGKPGDCVHILFVDDDNATDSPEHGFGDLEVFEGGVRAAANAGHAGANDGTRVGHGTNDRNLFADALLDVRGGDRGRDGDNEGFVGDRGLDLFEDVTDDLRLYRQQNDISAFDGGAIVGGSVDAKFDRQRGGFFLVANGCGDVLRLKESLFQESTEEDAAELASAENGKLLIGKFCGHGGNIVTEEQGKGQPRVCEGGTGPRQGDESVRE